MPEGINDKTQRICKTQPFCTCAGGPNEWDECCCVTTGQCSDCECIYCGAELVLIDIETGEKVAA